MKQFRTMESPWRTGLAAVVVVLSCAGALSAQAQNINAQGLNTDVLQDQTLTAKVNGSAKAETENVVFSGQVSMRSRVINDSTFKAASAVEMNIDLSQVVGRGVKTGKTYLAPAEVTLRRNLLAFDALEAHFPFYADDQILTARSAKAAFQIQYNAANGVSVTPFTIKDAN